MILRARSTALLAVMFFALAGCTDQMLSEPAAPAASDESAVASSDKLRHEQLLPAALSADANKKGEPSDVFAMVAFDEYEADGITRRIVDSYGLTRRILEEYGVTRRILHKYGVTRRILEDYGVTRRIIEQYGGLTMELLEAYGVTRRIADDYGMTPEELLAEMEDFDPAVKLRLQLEGDTPGASFKFDYRHWDALRDEFQYDDDIVSLEPDPSAFVLPPSSGMMQRGQKNYQLAPWNVTDVTRGQNMWEGGPVRVYVLDSGVNPYDLNVVERLDFTPLFVNRDQETWDEEAQEVVNYDPPANGNPDDENGHGTHIAGLIGALDNEVGIVGVAPGVPIHSMKVLTADGRTDVTTLIAAIKYVIKAKEQAPQEQFIMNMSLGMDLETTSMNILDGVVRDAYAAGIIVVASAGNGGRNAETYSPAHVGQIITVGAYDAQYAFADFSNFGQIVDLHAPGVDAISIPHNPTQQSRNSLVVESGTSQAAAHVSGAAALYAERNPDATPTQVRDALVRYARDYVRGEPAETTNKAVYAAEFGSNEPVEYDPLRVDSATWDSRYEVLIVAGTGAPLATVALTYAESGTAITATTVGLDGKWRVNLSGLSNAPCSIAVASRADAGSSVETVVSAVQGAGPQCAP